MSLRKILYAVMAGIFLSAVTSCDTSFDDRKDPDPDPVVEPTHRTILVYMVASNTLSGYDEMDIKEMQRAAKDGALDGCRLLIYHQKYESAGTPVLKEIKAGTGEIDTLTVFDNAVSSVSAERMEDVIALAKTVAPAEDYGLILWSHSNGWLIQSQTPDKSSSKKGEYDVAPLAFGEETLGGQKQYMNIPTLARTLQGKGFSFVYFDCCYMACIEVLYEMRGVTPYVVASTAEVIAEGMPYNLTLPYLFSKGEADLAGAVKANYEYVDAKTDYDRTLTLAVFDMEKVDAVAAATRDFYSFHPSASIEFKPQAYMYESTCFFFDFADIIDNLQLPEGSDPATAQAFDQARDNLNLALAEMVIYKANTPYIWPGDRDQIKINRFCGVSSYYLTSASQASTRSYDTTAWWIDVAQYLF